MKTRRPIATSALAIAATAMAMPLAAQNGPDSGPIARYDMRAGTNSGFAAMGQGNAMAMITGGGDQVQHELLLRLGSSQAPAGGSRPKAEHFMPVGARLGKSVELVTPREERGPVDEIPDFTGERGQPRGRLLIFWGCGEHAPQGQPLVIDFARLSRGELPAGEGLWTTSIPADWGPSLANSTTFGRWPAEDGKYARPDSSLPGAHRVAGNYSPEIAFTLTHDFMAPLAVRTTANPSGSVLLSWGAIAGATGYHTFLYGSKRGPDGETGDVVMWSSSRSRQFGGGLADWLSPATVAALVRDGTVLAPDTTQCLIPAEVIAAAPDFRLGTLTAFGPQEDFAYPPRPTDPRARWDLQWTARIRHRSTTSWMEAEGMSMGTATDSAPTARQAQQEDAPACKPRKHGLGGLGRAMGGLLGGRAGRALGNAAEDAATREDCTSD